MTMGINRLNIFIALAVVVLFGAIFSAWYWIVLEKEVEVRFQSHRIFAPSRIYARAPVIYHGMDVKADQLARYFERVGYRLVSNKDVADGEYSMDTDEWVIGIRPFIYVNGLNTAQKVTVHLDNSGRVSGLSDESGNALQTVHIEPAEIGAFIPPDGEDRLPVHLNEVPKDLINAVLVIEDRRFFRHGGIDLHRIGGALLTNLRKRRIVEGASTITQQLAKNLYLSGERTLIRKINEVLIAFLLEKDHSKQEILEAYLNEVYLGQDGARAIHGVGLAARFYFGKDIRDLGLSESALLAGIIHSPSTEAPYGHPEAARERRNFVLAQLLRQHRITEADYQLADESPLMLRKPVERLESAGYFVDYLRKELASQYERRTLEEGGLAIYTTLDLRMQTLAEEAVRQHLEKLEQTATINVSAAGNTPVDNLKLDPSPLQGAMITVEPRTGQVLALIGGRDYTQSPFNRVLAHRQPGSIFKPVVMLTALARNNSADPVFTLASILKDQPFHIDVSGDTWQPMNHDKSFRGEVTAREALERSLNVPMARLGAAVGYTQIISTARRMGITSPLEPLPSLPLGSFEVTLIEMARAYAVLASGGLRAPLRSVLAIIAPDGELQRLSEVTPYRIFRSAETYLVTSALQGSIDLGTSTHLRDLGYLGAVAGKTGSTNRFHDAWFFAYTPEIVVGAWVGFDIGRNVGISGAGAALPMVADFIIEALGRYGAARFSPPSGVERIRVAIMKNGTCHHVTEYFLSGTAPPPNCPYDGNIQETRPLLPPLELPPPPRT